MWWTKYDSIRQILLRQFLYQQAKNECVPLIAIYDEIAALPNYFYVNLAPF